MTAGDEDTVRGGEEARSIASPAAAQVPTRLARSAKLQLFLMLRYALDTTRSAVHLDAHLDWMIAQEKQGRIFLSGPVRAGDGGGLVGVTVLRAETLAAARDIAAADPFVVQGCVRFDILEWTAFEGLLHVSISLSDCVGAVR